MSTKFALPPFLLLLLGLWTPPSLNAVLAQQPLGFTTENQPPKLVVAITVDQMRADYLTRYAKGFGDGGFKRFFNEGFAGLDHHFSYAPTYTGPGHASIATGTTPAVHGIIGNNWFSRETGSKVYCVEDTAVQPVGMAGIDPGTAGQMSPGKLHASTWADEFKLHFSQREGAQPKVMGASMKDRGAILPAGHAADAAYWVSSGQFISSTHYMESLPKWVRQFNKSNNLRSCSPRVGPSEMLPNLMRAVWQTIRLMKAFGAVVNVRPFPMICWPSRKATGDKTSLKAHRTAILCSWTLHSPQSTLRNWVPMTFPMSSRCPSAAQTTWATSLAPTPWKPRTPIGASTIDLAPLIRAALDARVGNRAMDRLFDRRPWRRHRTRASSGSAG